MVCDRDKTDKESLERKNLLNAPHTIDIDIIIFIIDVFIIIIFVIDVSIISILGKFLLHIRKILPQKTGSQRQKHFFQLCIQFVLDTYLCDVSKSFPNCDVTNFPLTSKRSYQKQFPVSVYCALAVPESPEVAHWPFLSLAGFRAFWLVKREEEPVPSLCLRPAAGGRSGTVLESTLGDRSTRKFTTINHMSLKSADIREHSVHVGRRDKTDTFLQQQLCLTFRRAENQTNRRNWERKRGRSERWTWAASSQGEPRPHRARSEPFP